MEAVICCIGQPKLRAFAFTKRSVGMIRVVTFCSNPSIVVD